MTDTAEKLEQAVNDSLTRVKKLMDEMEREAHTLVDTLNASSVSDVIKIALMRDYLRQVEELSK